MSPAITLAWFVVGGSLISIVASEAVPVSVAIVRRFGCVSPLFRRPGAYVITGILLVTLLRPQSTRAVTPPPTDRIVLMTPEVAREPVSFVPTLRQRLFMVQAPVPTHTVVRGDTLWAIAKTRLEATGSKPSGSQVSTLWHAIYDANRSVIGNNPDLILPGQVLAIPGGSHG